MGGGVLWHYGGATSYAHDDAVPPRVAEMPGKNVGPGWRGRGRGRVHCSTDLPDCGIARWCIACSLCCLFGVSPRLCIALLAVKCGSNCRPTFGGSWGWLTARTCGVGPRVGTPKPTSLPRRRQRYLARGRVWGAKKYADRVGAAWHCTRTDLGRFRGVSYKGPQSKDHSGRGGR
jgi:hypothetical protein